MISNAHEGHQTTQIPDVRSTLVPHVGSHVTNLDQRSSPDDLENSVSSGDREGTCTTSTAWNLRSEMMEMKEPLKTLMERGHLGKGQSIRHESQAVDLRTTAEQAQIQLTTTQASNTNGIDDDGPIADQESPGIGEQVAADSVLNSNMNILEPTSSLAMTGSSPRNEEQSSSLYGTLDSAMNAHNMTESLTGQRNSPRTEASMSADMTSSSAMNVPGPPDARVAEEASRRVEEPILSDITVANSMNKSALPDSLVAKKRLYIMGEERPSLIISASELKKFSALVAAPPIEEEEIILDASMMDKFGPEDPKVFIEYLKNYPVKSRDMTREDVKELRRNRPKTRLTYDLPAHLCRRDGTPVKPFDDMIQERIVAGLPLSNSDIKRIKYVNEDPDFLATASLGLNSDLASVGLAEYRHYTIITCMFLTALVRIFDMVATM